MWHFACYHAWIKLFSKYNPTSDIIPASVTAGIVNHMSYKLSAYSIFLPVSPCESPFDRKSPSCQWFSFSSLLFFLLLYAYNRYCLCRRDVTPYFFFPVCYTCRGKLWGFRQLHRIEILSLFWFAIMNCQEHAVCGRYSVGVIILGLNG